MVQKDAAPRQRRIEDNIVVRLLLESIGHEGGDALDRRGARLGVVHQLELAKVLALSERYYNLIILQHLRAAADDQIECVAAGQALREDLRAGGKLGGEHRRDHFASLRVFKGRKEGALVDACHQHNRLVLSLGVLSQDKVRGQLGVADLVHAGAPRGAADASARPAPLPAAGGGGAANTVGPCVDVRGEEACRVRRRAARGGAAVTGGELRGRAEARVAGRRALNVQKRHNDATAASPIDTAGARHRSTEPTTTGRGRGEGGGAAEAANVSAERPAAALLVRHHLKPRRHRWERR